MWYDISVTIIIFCDMRARLCIICIQFYFAIKEIIAGCNGFTNVDFNAKIDVPDTKIFLVLYCV